MKRLHVLECPYPYAAWYADCTGAAGTPGDLATFHSTERSFGHRPMTDDYRLCGVYGAAGIPWIVESFSRDAYPAEPCHVAVPRDLSDKVCSAVQHGEAVLVSSGYCVYAPAVVGGMQRALGVAARIGVVWIDAHADSVVLERTSEPAPTLVGIPLSSTIGLTAEEWRRSACGLEVPCSPHDVVASDLRRSDDETMRNVREAGCVLLDEKKFEDEGSWAMAIDELSARVDAIYLAIDADILRPEYVPAYFREEPGGHTPQRVLSNAEYVLATGKVRAVSTFCFDFDKEGPARDVTCLNAMRIIGGLLSAWKKYSNG